MKIFPLLGLLLAFYAAHAQQTVGLFENSPESYNGYTLFAPMRSNTTFLIDNCGEAVHSWEGNDIPAFAVRLMEDGGILRTTRATPSPFIDGGVKGGALEMYDWDGNLTWSYLAAGENFSHHHDVEVLPNGNVLVIMVDRIARAEAIAAGRDSSTLAASLWSEKIVELRPIGTDSAEVVWEWKLWDHLVQDRDVSRPNFGVVQDHPELLDLNFVPDIDLVDWVHLNSISYNAELDQILLCSRHINEFWIIDHSTTTQEAASHSGGDAGRGGDLLYRWGNPVAYDRIGAQESFGMHGGRWVSGGDYDGGIVFFNNGYKRSGLDYSTIDVIVPPIQPDKSYEIGMEDPFAPLSPDFRYTAPDSVSFYSVNISGASSLPNGNILVCEGAIGHFFEINLEKEIVWNYVAPIGVSGAYSQGDDPVGNNVFKIDRFPIDYPAFDGRDLTPTGPLEMNPLPSTCMLTTAVVESFEEGVMLSVFPNPSRNQLFVKLEASKVKGRLSLVDILGRVVLEQVAKPGVQVVEVTEVPAGVYLLVHWDGGIKSAHKVVVGAR